MSGLTASHSGIFHSNKRIHSDRAPRVPTRLLLPLVGSQGDASGALKAAMARSDAAKDLNTPKPAVVVPKLSLSYFEVADRVTAPLPAWVSMTAWANRDPASWGAGVLGRLDVAAFETESESESERESGTQTVRHVPQPTRIYMHIQ